MSSDNNENRLAADSIKRQISITVILCIFFFFMGYLVGRRSIISLDQQDNIRLKSGAKQIEKDVESILETKIKDMEEVKLKSVINNKVEQFQFYDLLSEGKDKKPIKDNEEIEKKTLPLQSAQSGGGEASLHPKLDKNKVVSTIEDKKTADNKPVNNVSDKIKGINFTIQIAAFTKKEDALTLVSKLKTKGYSSYIISTAIPGKGQFYRVRYGKFTDNMAAQQAALGLYEKEASLLGSAKPVVVKLP